MRLSNIAALAHPAGNRIDLTWTNPDPVNFPGIQVVRRDGTHPMTPTDGVPVAQGTAILSASDTGLRSETTYYYTLFPFTGAPPQFSFDPHNRVSAVATGPYDFAGLIYRFLPAIYHRYDDAQANGTDTRLALADRSNGPLRRFLDLPGSQLNQIYSLARAALGLCDLDTVEGALLPLLAQWIGWRTDYGREVSAQRNELRFAPAVYRTVGIIPTVEATVKRITNWEAQTKEFVYNVARTNQPERLNLWSMLRPAAGTFAAPSLASLNFAYEGRPTAVQETDGSISFFYHTFRGQTWDIWTKSFAADGTWRSSAPVVDGPTSSKHPSAALQGTTLWLFWESQDPPQPSGQRASHIMFQKRTASSWSSPAVFGDAATHRRMPFAVADNAGGVWLFWLEQTGTGWALKYSMNNGVAWLANPVAFPADGGLDPRVENDLFILFHPTSVNQRLWVFWARHEAGGLAGQNRWTVAFRIKQSLDPAASDWSAVSLLPKVSPDNHDREPCALLALTGVELIWSSTRNGGWTLFDDTFNITTLTWGAAQQIENTPFSNRAPLAVSAGPETLLVFRSNQTLTHSSSVYVATQTMDARYAGVTTVDTRNTAKIALQGKVNDFQTYVYDTGPNGQRGNNNRIARDTIGLYLTPDIADPVQIAALVSRLANVLPDFIPLSERAVFITP